MTKYMLIIEVPGETTTVKFLYSGFVVNNIAAYFLGSPWPWLYGSCIYYAYVISVYHHWCFEFESPSGTGVQHYLIEVVKWLETGRWCSPVFSIYKTDHHDITEILLKVALNTIKKTNQIFGKQFII
jgi:hypothetical protein